MTDGNTYAINKHLDDQEDWDALQEVTTELEQAEARIEELEGKLARALDVLLEAETKKYHDAWLEVEIVELEDKLAKAVCLITDIEAALAELKGQEDD